MLWKWTWIANGSLPISVDAAADRRHCKRRSPIRATGPELRIREPEIPESVSIR